MEFIKKMLMPMCAGGAVDGSASAGEGGTNVVGGDDDFKNNASAAIPGNVRMFSGCEDAQTSADVGNVASFRLPADSGPGGAGGACTNALIKTLSEKGEDGATWVQILDGMRDILEAKKYTQVPQLSASRKLDMNEKFSVLHDQHGEPGSKRRAVLIGINYVGQQGELNGCHNDVLTMITYLESLGYQSDEMRILMDDGEHEEPTGKNIIASFNWLVEGAGSTDSLFLHYSGHGGYTEDKSGDEADGKDETLVPVDYQEKGQIPDDLIFEVLVMPVPEDAQLTCVMDCCHSGTVLDLPFMVAATAKLEGTGAVMGENPGFTFKKLFTIAQKLYAAKNAGADEKTLLGLAAKELAPMLPGGLGKLADMAAAQLAPPKPVKN